MKNMTVQNFINHTDTLLEKKWTEARKEAIKGIALALDEAAKRGDKWLCVAPEGRWIMERLCYGGKLNSYVYDAEWGSFFITAKTLDTWALRSHFRDLGFVIDYADENEPSSWFYIKTAAA